MLNPTGTILVVEDDENDQFLIERSFRKIGVSTPVHIVGSGDEALLYLKGEGQYADRAKFPYPTFLMTDLRMNCGSGFEVLYHLKTHPKWAVISAVVLTSSPDPDDIEMAYLLGASSYHLKVASPADLEKLLSAIFTYWMTCQVPLADSTGKHIETRSRDKLGERFHKLLSNILPKEDA